MNRLVVLLLVLVLHGCGGGGGSSDSGTITPVAGGSGGGSSGGSSTTPDPRQDAINLAYDDTYTVPSNFRQDRSEEILHFRRGDGVEV